MSKPTYEQKMELLERYRTRPMAVQDPDIIQAIKLDVVKAASNGVRKTTNGGPEKQDNALYNSCIGIYRNFLKERDSYLDMSGRNAKLNSEAMRGIINYLRSFMKSNGKDHADSDVLIAVEFMFKKEHWDRLNDYHRNRIQLRDIHDKISEILPMIKNGHNKRTSSKSEINNLKSRLESQQQGAGTSET